MTAPLLIVVDVQKGFVNDNSAHIVPDVVKLIDRWHSLGGKVVATRFRNAPDSQWVRLLGWSKLMDSPEIDLVDELDGLADIVIDKYSYTSLTDELNELLPEAPAPVYVCGIDTDICVTKTAVDLYERGNRPVIITDACASHAGIESHTHALETLRRFIGRTQLLTADEADQEIQAASS